MKILALETSAVACSACLCEDRAILAQTYQNSGLTHSRTLLPMVEDMLKNDSYRPRLLYGLTHRRGDGEGAGVGGRKALRALFHSGVHGLAPGPLGGLSGGVRHGRAA